MMTRTSPSSESMYIYNLTFWYTDEGAQVPLEGVSLVPLQVRNLLAIVLVDPITPTTWKGLLWPTSFMLSSPLLRIQIIATL